MSIGHESMGTPGDQPRGGPVPGAGGTPEPEPISNNPQVRLPSAGSIARPQYLNLTERSIVNEAMVLEELQFGVDYLIGALGDRQPSEIFHEGAGALVLRELRDSVSHLVMPGTDFATAIGAMKELWTKPFLEASAAQGSYTLGDSIRILDQKTLQSAAMRLERIHSALAEKDPAEQRRRIKEDLGGGGLDVDQFTSQQIVRRALVLLSADIARRTLDFSAVLPALKIAGLQQVVLSELENFAAESDPGPRLDFMSRPYSDPELLRQAREFCIKNLQAACIDSIQERPAAGGKGLSNKHNFEHFVRALVLFRGQALPFVHPLLKMAIPSEMLDAKTSQRSSPSFPAPSEKMTAYTLLKLVDLSQRLGSEVASEMFRPYLDFSPAAKPATPGEPSLITKPRLMEANDITKVVLLLSGHPSSALIRLWALKLQKACFYRLVPADSVTDSSLVLVDDNPKYIREYIPAVREKFERLRPQLDEHSAPLQECALSMQTLDQVLAVATGVRDPDNHRIPSLPLQSVALADLMKKLQVLAPRIQRAADPADIIRIFETVRERVLSVDQSSWSDASISEEQRRALASLTDKRIDIIAFINSNLPPR